MPYKDPAARKKCMERWRKANTEAIRSHNKAYAAANTKSSRICKGRAADSGQAGELIVRTDLLLRGLDTMVPENRACPDDVHFRSRRGWISVQVKVARVNKKTGHWACQVRDQVVSSDILAWVNLHDRTIRYRGNIKKVPPELLDEV